MTATDYLKQLNHQYLAIHRVKEDLFWSTYMGTSDEHKASAAAESAWTDFLSDTQYIEQIKFHLNTVKTQADSEEKQHTLTGLTGWLATFQAHSIESAEAKALKKQLIEFEAALFAKKQHHTMTFINADGEAQEGSLPVLSSVIRTSSDEAVRQSAHTALLNLEQWLLENGFLELVNLRNKFARSLGYDNYFDYSVFQNEQMTSQQLFTVLDDFEQRTRECHQRSLQTLISQKGDDALKGHNFAFSFAGDVMQELDPYVPFSQSLRRWVESFGRLNIDFSRAELTLDLLDRKGKYQNGFCHGPIPAFYDDQTWVPAKVNFTSNAKPDQVGSGFDGINTLFHEGGHAAHFSNVKMNAPCFSQEFAPTSMAYAETQSMFCDSLLDDADWLKLYAKNSDGVAVPDDVIKGMIDSKQPFKAYQERSILVVPYFERALYQLTPQELTPQAVIQLARKTEQAILGLACSPRPLMAIPHLLSDASACSYQGYLLAHMAVYQTRAYFMDKYGYLTDNPHIGPELAQHYWHKGNSINHNQTIMNLTGEGFNAKYLADECNLTVEQAWQNQLHKMKQLEARASTPVNSLNAQIRIVDGATEISNNAVSDTHMCDAFEAFITTTYA